MVPLSFRADQLSTAEGAAAAWPLVGLLGDPVGHSLSPLLHDAALSGLKIKGRYRAVQVASAELGLCLLRAEEAGVRGWNVTLPHKRAALELARERTALADSVGAVNTLVAERGAWTAHNTDVGGLQDALRASFPEAPWRGECAIVGAGGAARAAVVALLDLGAPCVRVLARRVQRAGWAEALSASAEPLERAPLESVSLLIQATPLGLKPEDPSPLDPRRLPRACSVMDLCYGPSPSRLLRSHAAKGPVADGRRMLCAQAIRSFRLWFPGTQPESYIEAALAGAQG